MNFILTAAFSVQNIIVATVLIAVIGLLVGLLLGFASIKLAVPVNEKAAAILEWLPGNNCGGCGFAGCSACSEAIANGKAPVNACPVGGALVADNIAQIMGVTLEETDKMVAYVMCAGDNEAAGKKFKYYGSPDCTAVTMVNSAGDKTCNYGCLGYGSCTKVCQFDAIHVVNGVAVVDKDKCTSCGACIKACPRHLIELVNYSANNLVHCSSRDFGKAVKTVCTVGCMGCKLCTRQCKFGAITVENNIAHIDYSKCTNCGACAAKCPTHAIQTVPVPQAPEAPKAEAPKAEAPKA